MFRNVARSFRAAAHRAPGSAVDRSLQLSYTNVFIPQHTSTGIISATEHRSLSQYNCFSSSSLVSPGDDSGSKRIYISKTGRRKKPTRKELANYAETLGEEADLWPNAESVLGNFPHAYNPRDIVDPAMNEDQETSMMAQITLDDFDEVEQHEDPPPYPGATPFLRWQVCFVFQAGDDMHHPMNRLVKLSFDVQELQTNCEITDAALERFLVLVGKRFKPTRGLERGQDKPQGAVTLTSNKYADREDNRRDLMQIFRALVKEAALAGTPQDPLLECSDFKQLVGETK